MKKQFNFSILSFIFMALVAFVATSCDKTDKTEPDVVYVPGTTVTDIDGNV